MQRKEDRRRGGSEFEKFNKATVEKEVPLSLENWLLSVVSSVKVSILGLNGIFLKRGVNRSLFLPSSGISLDFEFRINLRIFMLDLVKLLITPIFSLVLSSSSAYLNWTRLTTFSKKKELQKPHSLIRIFSLKCTSLSQ